jgi:hypothetical protein
MVSFCPTLHATTIILLNLVRASAAPACPFAHEGVTITRIGAPSPIAGLPSPTFELRWPSSGAARVWPPRPCPWPPRCAPSARLWPRPCCSRSAERWHRRSRSVRISTPARNARATPSAVRTRGSWKNLGRGARRWRIRRCECTPLAKS